MEINNTSIELMKETFLVSLRHKLRHDSKKKMTDLIFEYVEYLETKFGLGGYSIIAFMKMWDHVLETTEDDDYKMETIEIKYIDQLNGIMIRYESKGDEFAYVLYADGENNTKIVQTM